VDGEPCFSKMLLISFTKKFETHRFFRSITSDLETFDPKGSLLPPWVLWSWKSLQHLDHTP
jgi:hypothetical protein